MGTRSIQRLSRPVGEKPMCKNAGELRFQNINVALRKIWVRAGVHIEPAVIFDPPPGNVLYSGPR